MGGEGKGIIMGIEVVAMVTIIALTAPQWVRDRV